MVRLSCFLSLALAAQGLHAAPSVSRNRGDVQSRDVSVSRQITDIPAPQESNGDGHVDLESPHQGNQPRAAQRATEPPGGKAKANAGSDRVAKAPAPNNGKFPDPKQEAATQLGNAQRQGTKAPAPPPKSQNTPTERPGGKAKANAGSDRVAKAPAPNNGKFPDPKQEAATQLGSARRQGFRGSTKFKDTPEGAAAAAKSKNTSTQRPGGKTA